ncbi:cell division topological specificity factor MinE [Achromobacter xylosoxidans]|uniref:cell division topological specificity factor MinE n=1 Tax=Achromobacter anxifer TaxID=1287737 RepID=UPI00155B78FE|nr:cell division topological specificity factor MinE [Achromobacter anxifer]CAB5514723.1 Cell division topological specificity factor [Achromobacter anxifer]
MMSSIARFFQGAKSPSSANQAKERLRVMISHEHLDQGRPNFLPQLQTEIMQLLSKYLNMDQVEASVKVAQEDGTDLLQVEVILPPK